MFDIKTDFQLISGRFRVSDKELFCTLFGERDNTRH
jgi:hypothetical protein